MIDLADTLRGLLPPARRARDAGRLTADEHAAVQEANSRIRSVGFAGVLVEAWELDLLTTAARKGRRACG